MLAPEVLRLTEEAVRELHARGQEQRAQAVEAVLKVAASALTGQQPAGPRDYFTTDQAARALSVRRQTVEQWITSGQLPSLHAGGQTLVHREELLAFLHRLPEQQPDPPLPTAQDKEAAARRREFIVAGLDAEKLARLESLQQEVEEGRPLSRTQRREVTALEREITASAGRRLAEWTKQRRQAVTRPAAPGAP